MADFETCFQNSAIQICLARAPPSGQFETLVICPVVQFLNLYAL